MKIKNRRHELKCIINHLENHGNYLLNEKKNASDFQKGEGDGLLRASDILKGVVSGDCCFIKDCICRKKRKFCYDHYE